MRRVLAGAVLLFVVAGCGAEQPTRVTQQPATATVESGALSSIVSVDGILTHRSPRAVINRARGTYTKLPAAGDHVACGDVLYRVDDEPVRLLCGEVPAYRELKPGDRGRDVRQLNRGLRELGHDVDAGSVYTTKTDTALGDDTGFVFMPEAVRIAKVTGVLGAPARPGAALAKVTSGALEARVNVEAWQRREVKPGARARVVLPGNESVSGTVDRLGSVGRTVAVHIRLAEPRRARGLARAPAKVEIRTKGVANALSVPVTALVGKAGGGFAVEVVRGGGRRELVAVRVGLFDTSAGRVAVEGGVREGDRVVVPSS